MKKLISLFVLAAVMISCSACFTSCGSDLKGVEVSDEVTDYVLIDVKGYGKILVKLDPETAPITVENFKTLVSEKFYDGLIFHRVIKDFMIQGGDPKGDGTGGSEKTIVGEFSTNGIENNLKHERGVISMARSDDPDSASSQFFIMHKTTSSLDGKYAAFGKVLYGMETVDKIANVQTNYRNKPLKNVVINSIRFVNVEGTVFENQ